MKSTHLTLVAIVSAFLAGAPVSRPAMAADLVQLKLYWSPPRLDNVTVATAAGEAPNRINHWPAAPGARVRGVRRAS